MDGWMDGWQAPRLAGWGASDELDKSHARPAQGHRRRALALQILRGILVKVPLPCGALALQILRVILVTVPPPVPWLCSAGAPDLEGDPCHGAAAPPVVMERWRSRS